MKLLIGLLSLGNSKELVELNNELFASGDVVQETFRDENTSVVLALPCSFANLVADVLDDILQTLMTVLALLRDNDQVR